MAPAQIHTGVQSPHEPPKVRVSRPHEEVVAVKHDRVRIERDLVGHEAVQQLAQEPFVVRVRQEDRTPSISPARDVVQSAGKLFPWRPRHAHTFLRPSHPANHSCYLQSTPVTAAFLTRSGVQPTNNQAEQSLRTPVIMRKLTFGTRSPEGSRSQSVVPSLMLTAQRQGKSPLRFFYTLLTADAPTTQAALYRNPQNTS